MFFNKRKCPNCGKEIKAGWSFCPYCGERLVERRVAITPFESLFGDIEKEFEKIDRMFGSEFFKFPKFRFGPARGGGISITIRSGTGMEPKVEVRTAGEYRRFEPEIKRRLGVRPAIEEVEKEKVERPPRIPKVMEEPETKIQHVGRKDIITIKLPDVKREEDVEVRRLEQSIEVKAFAKDKAYFKLIPIPAAAEVESRFEDGLLRIEVLR